MSSELTIVMYHYVRELERTRYPGIKGLRTSAFRRQLAHLQRAFHPVSVAQVVHSIRTGEPLPDRAVLLTFDDGYIEHYATVFPILFDAGVPGAFFPPVAPVRRGVLLDVNRVHFILAVADPMALGREVDEAVRVHQAEYALPAPGVFREKWAVANRFDSAEVIYVKRMLQVALPEGLRHRVAQQLFARHVAIDEQAFAGELYATEEQFRVMQASGMYVGSHGDSHYWLDACPPDVQQREIDASLEFLRAIGSPVDDYWVMCYPYGGWNDGLLARLRAGGCAMGLTTRVATARIGADDPLLLPRYDTNDLPQ